VGEWFPCWNAPYYRSNDLCDFTDPIDPCMGSMVAHSPLIRKIETGG